MEVAACLIVRAITKVKRFIMTCFCSIAQCQKKLLTFFKKGRGIDPMQRQNKGRKVFFDCTEIVFFGGIKNVTGCN